MLLREPPCGNDSCYTGLSLHKLLNKGLRVQESSLLQVQAALFNVWLDLFQKTNDPEKLLLGIPDHLWKPEILRTRVTDT